MRARFHAGRAPSGSASSACAGASPVGGSALGLGLKHAKGPRRGGGGAGGGGASTADACSSLSYEVYVSSVYALVPLRAPECDVSAV